MKYLVLGMNCVISDADGAFKFKKPPRRATSRPRIGYKTGKSGNILGRNVSYVRSIVGGFFIFEYRSTAARVENVAVAGHQLLGRKKSGFK